MPNRLGNAVSPYLRSHADNPVNWHEWGPEAFAEARDRGVPVLVSIGYSTCHWCHVMARESFSDPAIAEVLNERFVAIKVDREEHPDVDASYLAAASAFTSNLGWPLNVFTTPGGKAFYAGTYFPPEPVAQHPAFRQVLGAVLEAWTDRRLEAEASAEHIAGALAELGQRAGGALPTSFDAVLSQLASAEDTVHGGFGSAPKFPVATVLTFLLDTGEVDAATRTLDAMAVSDLRDDVEGGFFRYATRADWSEPHYERMLYDNALLLDAYARIGRGDVAEGIADFLLNVLRQPGGAFASAQDSESIIDGVRNEGGYFRTANRVGLAPPAVDKKILTGWNGLAIGALARAGSRLARPEWITAAATAADYLREQHVLGGSVVRASIDGRRSTAKATLEDYGMFAGALLDLALATGSVTYAVAARELVEATLPAFAVPDGPDPVLAASGIAIQSDPSEGAYPSGLSAMAAAAHRLFLLTADRRYREASRAAMESVAPLAQAQPIAFGAALSVMAALAADATQLVVVGDGALATLARSWQRTGSVTAVVTEEQAREFADAGFELFEGRVGAVETAYLCSDFVCALPVTSVAALQALLDSEVRLFRRAQ
jgi:uncharacterized protein YyaL (SSP411 family)